MSHQPFRLGKALGSACLLWMTSFVWGSIVFMLPATRNLASIPYVARNPALSFPLLLIWLVLTFLLAKSYLGQAQDKVAEGLKLGLVFFIVNVVLNHLVLVLLLKNGMSFYLSLSLWLAYLLLVTVPWLTGRSLQTGAARVERT